MCSTETSDLPSLKVFGISLPPDWETAVLTDADVERCVSLDDEYHTFTPRKVRPAARRNSIKPRKARPAGPGDTAKPRKVRATASPAKERVNAPRIVANGACGVTAMATAAGTADLTQDLRTAPTARAATPRTAGPSQEVGKAAPEIAVLSTGTQGATQGNAVKPRKTRPAGPKDAAKPRKVRATPSPDGEQVNAPRFVANVAGGATAMATDTNVANFIQDLKTALTARAATPRIVGTSQEVGEAAPEIAVLSTGTQGTAQRNAVKPRKARPAGPKDAAKPRKVRGTPSPPGEQVNAPRIVASAAGGVTAMATNTGVANLTQDLRTALTARAATPRTAGTSQEVGEAAPEIAVLSTGTQGATRGNILDSATVFVGAPSTMANAALRPPVTANGPGGLVNSTPQQSTVVPRRIWEHRRIVPHALYPPEVPPPPPRFPDCGPLWNLIHAQAYDLKQFLDGNPRRTYIYPGQFPQAGVGWRS